MIDATSDVPFTVQPFEDVMAIRNVFDVTGLESVVVDEQFANSPDVELGPATPVAPVGPVEPVICKFDCYG